MGLMQNVRAAGSGFAQGFGVGVRTGRRLLNTATLGALDTSINAVKDGIARDFKPITNAINEGHQAKKEAQKSFKIALSQRESMHLRNGNNSQ